MHGDLDIDSCPADVLALHCGYRSAHRHCPSTSSLLQLAALSYVECGGSLSSQRGRWADLSFSKATQMLPTCQRMSGAASSAGL